ncbi:MAG TPA: hypothetical protein PKZ54_07130 [Syntrophorhabdaceae bacterium]|nr:hypothetical protein [Syntrophorhabdaceae bacterium]
MKKCIGLFIIASILLSTGCATMIRGTEEQLSITSEPDGVLVKLSDGQTCYTPCQITLKRNQSVNLRFEKEGCDTETLSVFPTIAAAGIILGGLIDYGTGAVYSLQPNPAHMIMKCRVTQQKAVLPQN